MRISMILRLLWCFLSTIDRREYRRVSRKTMEWIEFGIDLVEGVVN